MSTSSSSKQQKQKDEQQKYQKMAKSMKPKRPVLLNAIKAFVIGGLVCTFGQWIQNMYILWFDFEPEKAGNPTVATLIFIAILLTGFGIWDRFGQFAGAGAGVPVTGFANSIASAAIEHRSEGLVLGVGGNMFKLAGSVIVFGVVAAFVVGIVKTLIF
jgi:stage V sporulation protein AC